MFGRASRIRKQCLFAPGTASDLEGLPAQDALRDAPGRNIIRVVIQTDALDESSGILREHGHASDTDRPVRERKSDDEIAGTAQNKCPGQFDRWRRGVARMNDLDAPLFCGRRDQGCSTSRLINTSRGPIVVEADLIAASAS